MDRMLAVALGRPLGVDDRDCDVELPVPVDDEDLAAYFEGANVTRDRPALMSGSVALINLYKIAGRILRQYVRASHTSFRLVHLHRFRVYSIDIFMEDIDPTRKVELQRTVELLDQELTKWCDDLPGTFYAHCVFMHVTKTQQLFSNLMQ
jgi:hypothetical protein